MCSVELSFTFKNSKVLSTNRVILSRINLFVWIKDLFLNSLISLCLSVLCFRFSMQLSIYRFLTASEKSRVGIEGRRFRFHSCPRVLKKGLVGSNGLEPSTSRLSGVCSNQLSYEPALVEMSGIEPLTPCLQGRCSPS